MEHVKKFLVELPLFASFSLEKMEELLDHCYFRSYAPGEEIIQIGQPGQFLGILLSGRADAIIPSKTGKRIKIGEIRQGGFLGETSLLTGEPTNADVIAAEKCELFLIPPEIPSFDLEEKPIDEEKLKQFLCDERDFSLDRVEKAISSVSAARAGGGQTSLEKWF